MIRNAKLFTESVSCELNLLQPFSSVTQLMQKYKLIFSTAALVTKVNTSAKTTGRNPTWLLALYSIFRESTCEIEVWFFYVFLESFMVKLSIQGKQSSFCALPKKREEKKKWKCSPTIAKEEDSKANSFELTSLWQTLLLKLFSVNNFYFLPKNLLYRRTNQKALLKSVILHNPNNKNWNNFWPINYQKSLNASKINSWDITTSRTTKTSYQMWQTLKIWKCLYCE